MPLLAACCSAPNVRGLNDIRELPASFVLRQVGLKMLTCCVLLMMRCVHLYAPALVLLLLLLRAGTRAAPPHTPRDCPPLSQVHLQVVVPGGLLVPQPAAGGRVSS